MVSRISAQKGQMQLIQAFSRMAPTYNAKLLIVGSPLFGEEREYDRMLKFVVENNLRDKVEIREQVLPSKVYGEIAKMDICVHPTSAPEPLGQIVIQYLKMSRPTIVSNQGGYLDWVRDGSNAILVEANNVGSLQEKLETLIASPKFRDELGKRAGATPYPTELQIQNDLLKAIQKVDKDWSDQTCVF
jgi:glycosyltransferase involved in cell wall biosynthesis